MIFCEAEGWNGQTENVSQTEQCPQKGYQLTEVNQSLIAFMFLCYRHKQNEKTDRKTPDNSYCLSYKFHDDLCHYMRYWYHRSHTCRKYTYRRQSTCVEYSSGFRYSPFSTIVELTLWKHAEKDSSLKGSMSKISRDRSHPIPRGRGQRQVETGHHLVSLEEGCPTWRQQAGSKILQGTVLLNKKDQTVTLSYVVAIEDINLI